MLLVFMQGIIKSVFVLLVIPLVVAYSHEKADSFYVLENSNQFSLNESELTRGHVKKFLKEGESIEDVFFIEGTSDSMVAQKYALVSLKSNIMYVWAEPGLVNIESWDPIIDCLRKHVDAVNPELRNKACSRTVALDSNMKNLLLNLKDGEYMSLNSDYRVEYVKEGRAFKVGISKYGRDGGIFDFYNKLYEAINKTIDSPMKTCHWEKLIHNVKDFKKKTNNPKNMADIGLTCPDI